MRITSKAELDAAIIELEKRKLTQEKLLIEQFNTTRESLSPINLIKAGITKLGDVSGIQENVLSTIAGMGVGILSKKLFLGKSNSIIKKALGGIFEFVVARTTVNNADKIKAFGTSIYNNLFKKRHDHQEEDHS